MVTMVPQRLPRIADQATAQVVLSAPVLAAVGLMILNDHVLKNVDLLPAVITGKLSDFAFLFFAPIILAFVVRARTRLALAACYAVPILLFVAINLSTVASAYFAGFMSQFVPMKLWPDPTDLIALAVVPLSWRHLTKERNPRPAAVPYALAGRTVMTAIAALSCMATSPPPPMIAPPKPTHKPVFMSWAEFRTTAVQVLPPQPIGKRGKLLIVDHYLFISEPGQGVHLFDNRDPQSPEALLFIRIPGNIDIAVKGNLLYADSAVDLLVFKLDLARRVVTLMGRLEDQFDYNPSQMVTDEVVYLHHLDKERGVVVGFEPIEPSAEEQNRE